jgi:hypothetical protein
MARCADPLDNSMLIGYRSAHYLNGIRAAFHISFFINFLGDVTFPWTLNACSF